MDKSIFTDKKLIPGDKDLELGLGSTFRLWRQIREVASAHPSALPGEWNFPGEKYGWSFRIKDKKRVIIYLLPRDNYFKVAFVFGQKAFDEIMAGSFPEVIRQELSSAKIYAEGRGIRIDVKDSNIVPDILKLIEIKLKH
jgi:hypothetical protein